jgi:CheY-like chemotaxis protein
VAGSIVLIVLERPEQRSLFNQHLRGTPYRLVFANDGEDGFDRFREVRPDLIIAHVNARRLNGTILCQLVRQEEGGSIPFLLLGEDLARDPRAAERCAAVGADGFLSIPFDGDVLHDTLSTALEGPPKRRDVTQVISASSAETSPMPVVSRSSAPAVPSRPSDVFEGRTVFESKTTIDGGHLSQLSVENDDMPTSLSLSPILSRPDEPRVLDPDETTDGAGVASVAPPMASKTPLEAPRRNGDLLEEPPLPIGSLGLVREIGEGGATGRVSSSGLIREIPREVTPSAEVERPPEGEGQQRKARTRRGLDDSQLGKRLIRRVQHVHQLLDELDYYQLLGIDNDATTEQLRAAYFDLSLEFHPDRFFLLRSGDLKEKIYAIFRRVSEAYAVLSDDRRRAAYDLVLHERRGKRVATSEPPSADVTRSDLRVDIPTQVPNARRFAQLAQTAVKSDDLDGARLYLAFALAQDPGNAALRRSFDDISRRLSRARKEALLRG